MKEASAIVSEVVGGASQTVRTWAILMEAAEGGWGLFGTALGKEEFAALAAGSGSAG